MRTKLFQIIIGSVLAHQWIVFSIAMSILAVVAGQVLIKKGLNSLGSIDYASGIISAYVKMLLCPSVIGGIFLYGTGVIFWLYVLSKLDLSYAYPFLALTYVLMALCSAVFFHEHISLIRWIGIATICIGIFLITRT